MAEVAVEMNGADVLLLVEGATPGTYEAVGSQRGVTFEESNEMIDVSSKDSRARRIKPGRYSATASLEHLYVPTDSAYTRLKTAARNGDPVVIVRQEDGNNLEMATAYVETISGDFPDQGEAVISIDLAIDGEWEPMGV